MSKSSQKFDESLFPEVGTILGVLSRESEQEVVVLFIPSHDKHGKKLNNQDQWADEGMHLLADLFRGATAFQALSGIFKTDQGAFLEDQPILLESYATISAIHDGIKLNRLVGFLKHMGKDTRQDTVMVVIGTMFFYISDYSGV
ncbi:MAG: hypothetical protein IT440_05320 [Phycisphaeraceae bacterium]|nr:hypothetical protein [Phycisphaeraceae bacterium]